MRLAVTETLSAACTWARYLEKAGDTSYAKDFYEDACDMGKRDKDIREDRYMMQLWQEAKFEVKFGRFLLRRWLCGVVF